MEDLTVFRIGFLSIIEYLSPGRGCDKQAPGVTGGGAVGGAVLRHLKLAICKR